MIAALRAAVAAGFQAGAVQVLVGQYTDSRFESAPVLCLTWLLAQKASIVWPVPGTTNIAHMEENLGVAAITFTGDELRHRRWQALALGNAIFAATGKLARRTPFTAEYLAKA